MRQSAAHRRKRAWAQLNDPHTQEGAQLVCGGRWDRMRSHDSYWVVDSQIDHGIQQWKDRVDPTQIRQLRASVTARQVKQVRRNAEMVRRVIARRRRSFVIVLLMMFARRINFVRLLGLHARSAAFCTAGELLWQEAGEREQCDPSPHETFLNRHPVLSSTP